MVTISWLLILQRVAQILPNKVRWGDTAEDFNYPSSTWTASATNDAGAVTIGDEADEIIDGLGT